MLLRLCSDFQEEAIIESTFHGQWAATVCMFFVLQTEMCSLERTATVVILREQKQSCFSERIWKTDFKTSLDVSSYLGIFIFLAQR